MNLQTFKTLWGNSLTIHEACQQARLAHFDGIEGQAPVTQYDRLLWRDALEQNHCSYIAEIVTGGDYVPNRAWSLQQHLDDLAQQLENALPLKPLFATVIAGLDAWPENQSVEFFKQAIRLADESNIVLSFETHRSRSLFNPWVTKRVVEAIPEIKLTADISHWCVVCERLMDSEVETMQAIAGNIHHIHGRVGYDQGPQVPHPAAPEFAEALKSHQAIWELFWQAQAKNQYDYTTMTPEFGPDGYCHQLPFTQAPVADLWRINQWMNQVEKQHFEQVELT